MPNQRDRIDDRGIHRVGEQIADKIPVDLEKIHGQRIQIGEGTHSRTEVIQRKQYPAFSQVSHKHHRLGQI